MGKKHHTKDKKKISKPRLKFAWAQRCERLLQVLEARWLPQTPQAIDWHTTWAATWDAQAGQLVRLMPATDAPGFDLHDLIGIDHAKARVEQNTRQFLAGLPANNVLLWGSRGTGKSSLIRALLYTFAAQGLRVLQVEKEQLADLHQMLAQLPSTPWRFIIYTDDLSFEQGDLAYKPLKSLLDGSLSGHYEQVLLYATSNRRHLVPEHMQDNQASKVIEGELHYADAIEEKIALSDRFGLWISFYPFSQETYLAAAQHWLQKLALQYQVSIPWDQEARTQALRFAQLKGHRSGRTAWQFARHYLGQQALGQQALEQTT
ncbi:hypothetical protein SAMN05421831_11347 [Allopseudospirillum japonicum]|uniref:Uncharacterized protein n=1 Tax=Allopseudospirillum japonicum TaxID=64971 RepID=A0A1H6UCG7_9GAMM|nr:ATP-binding protein [Allopseudospirillum japonicum]SEI85890.1 hypothetical protein SAMN05421831_11347 [Allopseudospirillum japonicum]